MHWIDWLIVIVPFSLLVGLAIYTKKYVRGIADFLAAGRVAGRYVISVGDLQGSLAVIYLVASCEAQYQCGMAMSFWNNLTVPVAIFMSLTGYILYRYRQTKSLSMGQFLENRYNRPLRIVAASIRTVSEMLTNSIGPAVTARFFIYFMGFPPVLDFYGLQVSTFLLVVCIILLLAMLIIWPGGRISLLVTDSIQGLMSYPIFVIFTCFILGEISWHTDVAPVMFDRVPGESFLNPNDIQGLRDFNLFALIVNIIATVATRGAWIGNDTSGSGRTAHEQKMSGILGAWRNGFSALMMTMLAIFIIVVMNADRFSERAQTVRNTLTQRVAVETVQDAGLRTRILDKTTSIAPIRHTIGEDQPYSRTDNPDTVYLSAIQKVIDDDAERNISAQNLDKDGHDAGQVRGQHNKLFQQFRTLYFQMMTPTIFSLSLPVGLMGLFILLMVMLMVSTDDSRIFNASSTLVQDVIMPFRKKPFQKNEHLLYLRLMSVAVCVFFLFASLFLAQLDYLGMFFNIMCALWLGAAGPIMIGGLYTRWGTTTGAFCALIFGSGTSFFGLFCQNKWADSIYPYLNDLGYLPALDRMFRFVTNYTSPLIVWEMNPTKFPINSVEIFFLAMVFGFAGYTIGSFLTCRKPFNLDKMLHRGAYAETPSDQVKETPWTWQNLYEKLIGITPEYTKGDKVIAWSVFFYSIVYQFLISFVAVAVWNIFDPWPAEWWSWYFFITLIVVGLIVGVVSTVWFMWGGAVDLRQLFKDLAMRVDDPTDDGWVDEKKGIPKSSEKE